MSDSILQLLPAVIKSEGVTSGERYLAKLCQSTFLSLWTYPSVYRDQRGNQRDQGKEVCDLLVVFDKDIIIFSEKSCVFPDTGDLNVDWSRWFRKAVLDSARQIWGAERWIKDHPDRIFLDRACTVPFPIDLPDAKSCRFHRIVVARNVSQRCRQYYGGGSSGTLMFKSDIVGKAHFESRPSLDPFAIGWIDASEGFVHVFDDESLDLVLSNRDTVTEFTQYLSAKSKFLAECRDKNIRVSYTGEDDLLGEFLFTLNNNSHRFSVPEGVDAFLLDEGSWQHFLRSPQRKAQLEANMISYTWDEIIEKFNTNILGGTSLHVSDPRISEREKLMRIMARETRTRRRMLSESLCGLIEKTGESQQSCRVVAPSHPGDACYCFLLVPKPNGISDFEYREFRLELLRMYCLVTKLVCSTATEIVGIATEPGVDTEPRSEDAIAFDASDWQPDWEAEARRIQQEHGILRNIRKFEDRVFEFPLSRPELNGKVGKNPRNKPCPCGSGKKYKKCHGGG